MYRIVRFLSFAIILFHCYTCESQLFPAEGLRLCYRIIGFSFPVTAGATKYMIEIDTGIHDTESDFEKSIVTTVSSEKNKIIAEVPFWGCTYTWRTVAIGKNNTETKSAMHHFMTKITEDVDTTFTRLRIIKSAEKYKDAYVFMDGARVLYDMKGNPVWFLPGTDEPRNRRAYPRDLKMSPKGTITFITGLKPYEITYNGVIEWKHNENTADTFHHEFTRLNNGHYMAMKFEDAYWPLPDFADSIAHNAQDSSRFFRKANSNTVVEYDAQNNLVWRWSDYNYIINSDLIFRKTTDRMTDLDMHENSFYFDEQRKVVYLSFRNANRIIKIKYPEGNVLNTYGPIYHPDGSKTGNELFCGQHSCHLSQKGYLYLYDNNTCGESHMPKIIEMIEPGPGGRDLKKIWEYECAKDDPGSEIPDSLQFISGGNVLELPDQSMFVSMGLPYCKVFIVSQDKKILWSAIIERNDLATDKWKPPVELYRASIISSRKELEQLIWNAEKDDKRLE